MTVTTPRRPPAALTFAAALARGDRPVLAAAAGPRGAGA
jgi:hypothetical protein